MSIEIHETILPNISPKDTKFVKALKTIMWVKRLDEKELAEVLDTNQEQVRKWLDGETLLDCWIIWRLSRLLDIAPEYFLEDNVTET